MLTLASKLKRDDGLKGSRTSASTSDSTRRVSVRDKLLVKGKSSSMEAGIVPCNKAKLAQRLFEDRYKVAC